MALAAALLGAGLVAGRSQAFADSAAGQCWLARPQAVTSGVTLQRPQTAGGDAVAAQSAAAGDQGRNVSAVPHALRCRGALVVLRSGQVERLPPLGSDSIARLAPPQAVVHGGREPATERAKTVRLPQLTSQRAAKAAPSRLPAVGRVAIAADGLPGRELAEAAASEPAPAASDPAPAVELAPPAVELAPPAAGHVRPQRVDPVPLSFSLPGGGLDVRRLAPTRFAAPLPQGDPGSAGR